MLDDVEELGANQPPCDGSHAHVDPSVCEEPCRQLLLEDPQPDRRTEGHHHAEAGDLERTDVKPQMRHLSPLRPGDGGPSISRGLPIGQLSTH
jgi:hypothetical protein